MRPATEEQARTLRAAVDAYNECFYRKDLAGLRALYAPGGGQVYFDNHPGCDADDLEAHLAAVGAFFQNGKATESGDVEPLTLEKFRAWAGSEAALVTAVFRYASAPRPGVRGSVVFERDVDDARSPWLIRHIHFSFDPNESA